jgi:hypothetical protein
LGFDALKMPSHNKKIHPLEQAVRASLRARGDELRRMGNDRFRNFRVEMGVLYLGAFSPTFVRDLLKEEFPGDEEGAVSRAEFSIHTVEFAYRQVYTELVQGDLVLRLGRVWQELLRRHKLGPWHPAAPEWLAAVFRDRGIKVPRVTSPKVDGNSNYEEPLSVESHSDSAEPAVSRRPGEKDQIELFLDCWDRVRASNPEWDALSVEELEAGLTGGIAAVLALRKLETPAQGFDVVPLVELSLEEKKARLKEELSVIREFDPNFTLSSDEVIIALDLGLSGVRKAREECTIGSAAHPIPPRAMTNHFARKPDNSVAVESEGSIDERASQNLDEISEALTLKAERESEKVDKERVVKEVCAPSPVETQSLSGKHSPAPNLKLEVDQLGWQLPSAGYDEPDFIERASPLDPDTHNEGSWVLRDHLPSMLRRDIADPSQMLGEATWQSYLPDMTGGRRLADCSEQIVERVFVAWAATLSMPMRKRPTYVIDRGLGFFPFDPSFLKLAQRGLNSDYCYGKKSFGNNPSMCLPLIFMLEECLTMAFLLPRGDRDPKSGKKYLPMAYVWDERDADVLVQRQGVARDIFGSVRPFYVESLYPEADHEIPEDYRWLPGRGYMLESNISRANQLVRGSGNTTKVSRLGTSEKIWGISVAALANHSIRAKDCRAFRYPEKKTTNSPLFDLPWLVRIPDRREDRGSWMTDKSLRDIFTSTVEQDPLESMFATRLCEVLKIELHLPTLDFFDAHLTAVSLQFQKVRGEIPSSNVSK